MVLTDAIDILQQICYNTYIKIKKVNYMPTIRIDDDVMRDLQRRAVGLGLVFGSPNDVLRHVLGLNEESLAVRSADALTNDYDGATAVRSTPSRRRRTRTASGSVLLRQHQEAGEILSEVKRGLYHRDGRGFAQSSEYPVAFFDPEGYVIINSEQDISGNAKIEVGANVSVRDGIKSLPGYVRCEHSHIQR